MREIQYGRGATRADIEDLTIRMGTIEREEIRLINVADVDEAARLPSILEDERSFAGSEGEGKVFGHTGVGIRNRLARTENIEIAKHSNGNSVRTADGQKQLLLSSFGDGGDTLRRKGLFFIGWKGAEERAAGHPGS